VGERAVEEALRRTRHPGAGHGPQVPPRLRHLPAGRRPRHPDHRGAARHRAV